jgi:hypothetical protein
MREQLLHVGHRRIAEIGDAISLSNVARLS